MAIKISPVRHFLASPRRSLVPTISGVVTKFLLERVGEKLDLRVVKHDIPVDKTIVGVFNKKHRFYTLCKQE